MGKAVKGALNDLGVRFMKNPTSAENGTTSHSRGGHESGRESGNGHTRHIWLAAFPNVPDRTVGARYVPAVNRPCLPT